MNMDKKTQKGDQAKVASCKKSQEKSNNLSYRLKCAKTANGLSHFVMYGDVSEKKTLL